MAFNLSRLVKHMFQRGQGMAHGAPQSPSGFHEKLEKLAEHGRSTSPGAHRSHLRDDQRTVGFEQQLRTLYHDLGIVPQDPTKELPDPRNIDFDCFTIPRNIGEKMVGRRDRNNGTGGNQKGHRPGRRNGL